MFGLAADAYSGLYVNLNFLVFHTLQYRVLLFVIAA